MSGPLTISTLRSSGFPARMCRCPTQRILRNWQFQLWIRSWRRFVKFRIWTSD